MEPILSIRNISKRFSGNNRFAVKDFSLEVRKGEIVALLGESGCGKTTILRIISGFEDIDSGQIILDGVEVAGNNAFIEAEKRGVGIVFQDYALFPNKTVEQNIAFGLYKLPNQNRIKRVQDALILCGLEGLEKRYPHQVSGGQKQRVALARALAPRPKMILFDEPFSNIDTLMKAQMRTDIGKILRQTETTAIFVTHDTRDVLSLADNVAVIREGVLQQIGKPSEVYRNPSNSYVARFFGKTNLLKATSVPGGFQTSLGFLSSDQACEKNNSRVLLSVRPDDFEVCNPNTNNCFMGKVIHDNYMGNIRELTLEVPNPGGQQTELLLNVAQELKIEGAVCCFRQKSNCDPGILEH